MVRVTRTGRAGTVLAGVVVLTGVAAGACGNLVDTSNYDTRGGLALGMNGAGEIIAHVEACQFRVDEVRVVQGRELLGGEPNPRLGLLVTDQPQTGRFEVNLSNPRAPWRAEQPLTEPPDPEHIVIVDAMPDGSTSPRIEGIRQESASRVELEALAPGEVIVSEWNPDAGPTESPLRNLRIRLEDFHPECPAG